MTSPHSKESVILALGNPLLTAVLPGTFEDLSNVAASDIDLSKVGAAAMDTNVIKQVLLNQDLRTEISNWFGSDVENFILGQSLVESWNNTSVFSREQLDKLRPKFKTLKSTVESSSPTYVNDDRFKQLSDLVDELATTYEGRNEADFYRDALRTWKLLIADRDPVFAPRESLLSAASVRFQSGFPPGFEDEKTKVANRYGDFYIWADLIWATLNWLDEQKPEGNRSQVIFIINDEKSDWYSGGQLHPVLKAEFKFLTGLEVHAITWQDWMKLYKASTRSRPASATDNTSPISNNNELQSPVLES